METTPVTQSVKFSDYNYRKIIACAELFFSKPENQKGFEEWRKEYRKQKKKQNA